MLIRKDEFGRKRPGPLLWLIIGALIILPSLGLLLSAFRFVTSGPRAVPPAPTSTPNPEARIPKRFYPPFGTVYTPQASFSEVEGKVLLQLELFQPPHPRPSDWNLIPTTHPDGSRHFLPPEEVQDWIIHDLLEALNYGQKAILFPELRTRENLEKYMTGKMLEILLENDVLCAVRRGGGERITWVHYCLSKTECVVGYHFSERSERACYDRNGNFVKTEYDDPAFIYSLVTFEDGRWKWKEKLQEFR